MSYRPRLDVTPEAASEVSATVYSLLTRGREREAAYPGGDNKEGGEDDRTSVAPSGSRGHRRADRRKDVFNKTTEWKEVITE